MFGRDNRSCQALSRIILTLSILTATAGVATGQRRLGFGTEAAAQLEGALLTALSEAESKLARAKCLVLFSDFRDADGRTLQQSLDSAGRTGASYLRWMVFFDGYGMRRCEDRDTLASTSPKSRIIFVCGPQFLAKARSDPGLAAAMLIHEELHSLGLGENPPTSKHITAKVIERCGR